VAFTVTIPPNIPGFGGGGKFFFGYIP
jgi:hypothetical protein